MYEGCAAYRISYARSLEQMQTLDGLNARATYAYSTLTYS